MKTITRPPTSDRPLKATRGLPQGARVDRDRRTIFGVSIIELGPLNAPDEREWFADETTLQQALALGKSSPKGVKSRLTHPNMSNDGMGRQLGRFRSFRMSDDGQRVLADLHLASFAFRGGENSIGGLVLDMAEEDPGSFGTSLAPVWDDKSMKKLKASDGKMPMRFSKLIAIDIVDEPAATRGGLFGDSPLSIATAPHKATHALDTLFADATPEVIRSRVEGFLATYLASRFGDGQGNHERDDMSATGNATPTALTQEALDATLARFGDTLSTKLLGQVDEKLAALKPKDPEQKGPTVEEIEKRGALRAQEIMAFAATSGLSDHAKIAQEAIAKGLSMDSFKASLTDRLLASNGLSKDSGEQNADPDAKYKAEYRANLSSFVKMELTEAEYVLSRKIDDGKELLTTAKQKAAAA